MLSSNRRLRQYALGGGLMNYSNGLVRKNIAFIVVAIYADVFNTSSLIVQLLNRAINQLISEAEDSPLNFEVVKSS